MSASLALGPKRAGAELLEMAPRPDNRVAVYSDTPPPACRMLESGAPPNTALRLRSAAPPNTAHRERFVCLDGGQQRVDNAGHRVDGAAGLRRIHRDPE